jgi:hypothetical protein
LADAIQSHQARMEGTAHGLGAVGASVARLGFCGRDDGFGSGLGEDFAKGRNASCSKGMRDAVDVGGFVVVMVRPRRSRW